MENALSIRNVQELKSTAELMVASGFFKDVRDIAQASVKIMAGQELGVDPVSAMRGIDIVQGQIVIRAHLMAGMIKRHGKYNYKVLESTASACVIEFFENGESVGLSAFDQADAQAAGLLGKGPWKQFPKAMYYNRAIDRKSVV